MAKIILILISSLFLSGCFSLNHESTPTQRYSSYTDKPKGCDGDIPIVVHWGSGWHTSLVIPNKGLKVSHYFKNFPFLEVNWGDKGFYKAGGSELKQKLAAPRAILMPSESVMYFEGVAENHKGWCSLYDKKITLTESDKSLISKHINNDINICSGNKTDYGYMFQFYDARQIWVSEKDFTKLTQKINQSIHVTEDESLIDLGNGYLFDSVYSTAGRFFESSISYFGLFHTCNTWTAEVLGEIETLKSIRKNRIYRSEPIFEFLEKEIKIGNACVRKFE